MGAVTNIAWAGLPACNGKHEQYSHGKMDPEDVVKGKEQQKQLWQILVRQKVQPLTTKPMNNY